MAIATRTRPELIVVGTVARRFERTKRGTTEVFGHSHTIETRSGGVQVATFVRDMPAGLSEGTLIAAVVTVEDDPQYGSQLTCAREVNPGDVDLLISASGVATK